MCQWGFLFCVESSTLYRYGLWNREGFLFLAQGAPVYVAGKEHHEGEDYEDEYGAYQECVVFGFEGEEEVNIKDYKTTYHAQTDFKLLGNGRKVCAYKNCRST